MNNTQYMVFWMNEKWLPCSQEFSQMKGALDYSKILRSNPLNRFVTMATENVDMVGKSGVDSVENGILPDGLPYVYVKRRLGGA